eukprot:TRINITY_DN20640_c0_g1_i1.p1 TRINITY_DN20640_c0_g1~~TRINITY_DN20640_c0_g1_i1.p1  ORF type:complete len:340 (-),score=35.65 TRINITY_DN20640_c0_g1_i1:251-1192(-)
MVLDSKTPKEIGAACLASTAVPLSLNWCDVIKTRMQGSPAPGSIATAYAGGFRSTASRILAEEGFLSLYATALPASLMRECLAIGTRIGAYPAVRDVMSSLSQGQSGGNAAVSSKLSSAVVLGVVSGLLASPCDLVRIRLQSEAGLSDAHGTLTTGLRAGLPRTFKHSPHAFASLVSSDGILGLWRGAGVNVLRSVCTTVGTVPVYEHTKHLAKSNLGVADSPALHFGAGFVAGVVGTTATAPADIVRTRIMAEGKSGVGVVGAVTSIAKDYGPLGFFRGWVPAYCRLGPLFLCMPALIEQVRKHVFGLDYIK